MIKRPKATDTEDDILRMQNEFLTEQKNANNFQPAAKLVKVEPSEYFSETGALHNRIIFRKIFH